MRLLLITNLYPPQELGGYGRCMADFAWGLQRRGHTLQVITSDASYLGPSSAGPSAEPVDRRLRLKGSFQGGVHHLREPAARAEVDANNRDLLTHWLSQETWDGILTGESGPAGHRAARPTPGIGSAPASSHRLRHAAIPTRADAPKSSRYKVLAASSAVRQCLKDAGMAVEDASVIYPGARVDLFGAARLGRPLPPAPNGTWDDRCGCALPAYRWAAKDPTPCWRRCFGSNRRG